jgi:L-lysine exporter family protein LysE/ArgO
VNDTGLVAIAVEGFLLGVGLIVAIGAQNAFVLRQGLLGRHVFAVAATCALADALLIAAGVGGLGLLIRRAPSLLTAVTLAGGAFLFAYGAIAFRRALSPRHLDNDGTAETGLAAILATCLALTFLNPHVYLDTVVLIGALSARYTGPGIAAFGIGAALASLVWFFGLAYGARLLAPVFTRPRAWQVLDVLIGLIMWSISARLVAEAMNSGAIGD